MFCIAKETKKTIHRMGENNCKWSNQQRVNLQNTETAHAVEYQKNKQSYQKMGRKPK